MSTEIANDEQTETQYPKIHEKLGGLPFHTVHSFTPQMFNEYLPCISTVLGLGNMAVEKTDKAQVS